ncbi:MAG TPA: dipeptidase [Longimicrobiales bacterium]|nr:dipeptidase [Longimicrobiales bacterium]
MATTNEVQSYIRENRAAFREEFFEFLRIPSVSARSEHAGDVRAAAEWLGQRMTEAGLDVSIHDTPGHPIVLGEWRGAGADQPTVLIYGHYDVQPAEPLELWTSPAFEPEERDGRIYARGAVDDKGQFYLHVKAVQAHLQTTGRLPVNVILLAEGEEEVGSANLMPFVEEHAERLGCDAVVISDSGMFGPGMPTIGASLRGLAYFELRVRAARGDLHSGSYGGAVANPATALARIIASFHDDTGHIAIPGFYDDVQAAPEFVDQIRSLPFDDDEYLQRTGAPALFGEDGFTTLERLWIRPTCEVNGLLSGYTGEGSKTVLPAEAMAKVSCRLVPDQDPARIADLFRRHVEAVTPPGVAVEILELHGGRPWRARLEGPLYEAAARALSAAFGADITYAGEGGSIPIVPEFEKILGAPVLLMGFGLPGENAHAPDEWMSVENFEKGAEASALLLRELADR